MSKNKEYFENCKSLFYFGSSHSIFNLFYYKISLSSKNSIKYEVQHTVHEFQQMIEFFNSAIALNDNLIVICLSYHGTKRAISTDGGGYSDGVFILNRETDTLYQIDIECCYSTMRIKI